MKRIIASEKTGIGSASLFHYVRLALSCLLLLSSVLKGYALLSEPIAPQSWLDVRQIQVALVEVELFVALWTAGTLRWRLAWQVLVGLFSCFWFITFAKLLAGETSCGCFGRIEVHPMFSLLIDTVCLGSLLAVRNSIPQKSSVRPLFREVLVTALLLAPISIPAAVFMLRPVGSFLGESTTIVRSGEVIVLEPSEWVGQKLPILEYISTNLDLSSGEWLIVLVRHGCPTCEESLPRYLELERTGHVRLFLLEVPPHAQQLQSLVEGRLRDDIEWFVQTPTEIVIVDGVVTRTSPQS